MHRLQTEPSLGDDIARAEQEQLDEVQRANLRRSAAVAPVHGAARVVGQARTLAASRCEHAWRAQRRANDWKGAFSPTSARVMRLARGGRTAVAVAGVSKYEGADGPVRARHDLCWVDRVSSDLKQWLPGLVRQAREHQARRATIAPIGPFSTERQRALCERVTRLLGFDFSRGGLDVSTHPFRGACPRTCA